MSTAFPNPNASPGNSQSAGGASKVPQAAHVALGILIAVGVLVALCCGGGALITLTGGLFSAAQIQKMDAENKSEVTRDPADVRAAADEIARFAIPPDIAPQLLIDLKIPFTGKPLMKMAAFANEQDRSMIMTGEFNMGQGTNAEQMEAQMRSSMAQQNQGQQGHVNVRQTRRINFQFRGKPGSATLGTGPMEGGNAGDKPRDYVQATGTFTTADGGTGIVVIQVPADKHPEAEVEHMLRSMQ